MKIFVTILIILDVLIIGCTDNSYEHKEVEVSQTFNKNTSLRQKQVIEDFLEGKIKYGNHFDKISGGFYCLWKRRDSDISPHLALDDMFLKEKFKITTNEDSLQFIIICENISHKVGTYTNGGEASKIETIISVIDLKKELAYIVDREMGSEPPAAIISNTGTTGGSIGSVFSDENIFDFLKKNIIKK
jgi:hypothetical protein